MVRVKVQLLPVGRAPIFIRVAYVTPDRVLTGLRKFNAVPYGKVVVKQTNKTSGVVESLDGKNIGSYERLGEE